MPQDVRSTTPSTPLSALAKRWWLALALAVIFGAAGAGYSSLQPTTYTAEARVAVGSESLDARIVAGYSTAATQLASDISRYVNDQEAQASVSEILGDAASDVTLIAASPIAGSSVVRIEVQGTSMAAARTAAQTVANELAQQVNNASGASADELLLQYTDLSSQVAVANQAAQDAEGNLANLTGAEAPLPDLDAARGLVAQTASALSVLQVRQQALAQQYRNAVVNVPSAAGLRVVMDARIAGSDANSRMQKYGLAGLVAGLVLALAVSVALDRSRASRARRAARFAAGSPVAYGTKRPASPVKPSGKLRDTTTLDVDRAAESPRGSGSDTESATSKS